MTNTLEKIGGFTSDNGAEIITFNPATNQLFIVSGGTELQILDISDPTNITEAIPTVDLASFVPGIGGANSIAFSNNILAVALEAETSTDNGFVALVDVPVFTANTADPNAFTIVQVGALPDMVTFTPDGSTVLVANEGEPDEGVDPDGSISIIDVSSGVANITQSNVSTADFTAFNGREVDLGNRGVRIFPGTSVAQDVEPEFIAVSPDGTTAFVTLQEANAFGVVDIASSTVVDILPLGVKDYSQGQPTLEQFEFSNLPVLGTTEGGQEILLGGLSGLFYEGSDDQGNLQFVTVPDRGPNGEPTDVDGDGDNERPFALPDYQAQVIRFTLNPNSGEFNITETILLTRGDGTTPITGLPNIPGIDEEPVDLSGNLLDYDPLGADMEGVVIAGDGTFWMVDEYRPAIYNFSSDGVLINRFVPQGTADLAGEAVGTFGSETLPAEYANRRRNRGFEAIALDSESGVLYAFIQTPLANPDRAASDASSVIRILGIDTTTGSPVEEYVYLLEDPDFRDGGRVDKIGDAVYTGNGQFFVIERDSAVGDTAIKPIYQIDITGATNLLAQGAPTIPDDTTLEQLTPDGLAALGIQAVDKIEVTNLPSLGYLAGDKPEGLTILPDGRLAVLNDNDFGLLDQEIPIDGTVPLNPNPTPVTLGLIDFAAGNTLDASDEDGGINLQNYPVFGLYQPDAIASFEVEGETYYITANEGDTRDEDVRVEDLTLDPQAFPDAATLQLPENLGRLGVSSIDGDLDGDGDYDQLFTYGGRSFSIFDSVGNLVFDSSDDFATITAQTNPSIFNSNGEADSFDSRSDAKGAEPEGVTTGVIGDSVYAFIGLERVGGIMVYDVTNPTAPEFVQYAPNPPGDVSPEGLVFISATDSPTGQPLLVAAYEESDSVAVFNITDNEGADSGSNFLDFRDRGGETITVNVNISIQAAFNNTGGFYRIDDDLGTVTDPLTGNTFTPGDDGYATAALNASISASDAVELLLDGGFPFAPYMLANGDENLFYCSFAQANPDGLDHVRDFGNGSFGFEDLFGLGDADYNDFIIAASFI